jgi:hypothetical protein
VSSKKTKRREFFEITGYMPNSDHAMWGHAQSREELAQRITELFEQHPKVIYVEIVRFKSGWQSLQEIYDAVGRDR